MKGGRESRRGEGRRVEEREMMASDVNMRRLLMWYASHDFL